MSNVTLDRVPPQNIDAERAILGALMLPDESSDTIPVAMQILVKGDFYKKSHQDIYAAVISLFEKDINVDLLTVTQELGRQSRLERIGGVPELDAMIESVPTGSNVKHYADMVKELSMKRQLIVASARMYNQAFDDSLEFDQVIGDAEQVVLDIRMAGMQDDHLYQIKSVLTSTSKYVNAIAENPDHMLGIATGFPELDKCIKGIQKSDYTIIAGRPSMGKSMLAQQIAQYAAIHCQEPVCYFSLEMSKDALGIRIMSSLGGVPLERIREGYMTGEDQSAVAMGFSKITDAPMFIDDTPNISIEELRAKCHQVMARQGLGLVIVDYFTLMHSTRKHEGRLAELNYISTQLKGIARSLNVGLILVSQLNRNLESRPINQKRPILSDLRECVTGDTLIQTETGQLVAIQDLDTTSKIATMDQHYKIKWACPSFVKETGQKSVFAVQTRTGRRIRATANHPFLTINGWVQLADLKEGDIVGVARNIEPVQVQDESLEICRFLGYMIGDGSYLKHREISFTNKDIEVIEDVKRIVTDHIGGIAFRTVERNNAYLIGFSKEPHFDLLGGTYRVGYSNRIRKLLQEWGIDEQIGHEKRVPSKMFELNTDCIASFIAGLIVTDGSICYSKSNERWYVKYSSVSRELLEDIQTLLLRFGVVGVIDNGYKSKKATMLLYNIIIYGDSAQMLLSRIARFLRGAKHKKAIVALEYFATRQYSNAQIDRLPLEVTGYVANNKQGLSWSQLGYRCQGKRMCRETAECLGDILDDQWLKDLGQSDILWETVVSIDPAGIEPVYDLSVDGTHNFVANSFIVHNSGCLEQDADLVMFVYRKAYYATDLAEKLDRSTEIIVAKQRNGPLATIDLEFHGEIVSFKSV